MYCFITSIGLVVLACLAFIVLDATRFADGLIKSDCDSFRFLLEEEARERKWRDKRKTQ